MKNYGKVPVSGIAVSDPNAVISGNQTIANLPASGLVTITATVVVKNTGNVTMTDIYVTDSKDLLDFSRPNTALAPGEADSVTAEHRVTEEDVNAGKIVTAGIAHGTILTAHEFCSLEHQGHPERVVHFENVLPG